MMRQWVLISLMLATGATGIAEENEPATAPVSGSKASVVNAPPAPELQVKPWRVFGTGKADGGPQSINPPDGLAFTADGLLLATDAKNHRVQIFDPMSGVHLGLFGRPESLPGEVVGIAVAPDGSVAVSDEVANQAYVFKRSDCGNTLFTSAGPPILKDAGFGKLTGIAYDSAGRLYAIDTLAGEVRRYLPGFVLDPSWTFQHRRPDGGPMLHHADGIVLCQKTGTLFVASERDGMVLAYDAKTGCWLGKTIGRRIDPVSAEPIGTSVFSRSVEGLAILGDYLLAMDEGFPEAATDRPGRLLVFRLDDPALYETDFESCRTRIAAGRTAGFVGWLGNFGSPDGVAAFAGSTERPEPLVAVADQHHYRVMLYKGTELIRAICSASAKECQ